jgi:hypothetical protein
MSAGYHSIIWDAGGQTSGVYFYKITAPGEERSGRMTLVK